MSTIDMENGSAPSLPLPSSFVKTLSNISTTSTVTIDSAFSDSSGSPTSHTSSVKGMPPKSPHSLPPLPTLHGRSRSFSADSHQKKGSSLRKKGMKKANSIASGLGNETSDVDTKTEIDRLLRKLRKNIKRLGDQDPAVGAVYTALGNLHFRDGRINEAISYYRGAIECREGDHTATACLNLGTAYWNQRNIPESIKYLTKSLETLESTCARSGTSPELNADVASCHHQLGLVYGIAQDFDLAVYEIEYACRIRLAMHGSNHPITARTIDAAGRVHRLRGDYEQALHCHEQALTVLQGTPYAIATLDNIAQAHTGRGDILAAVHIYVEIVQSLKARWHGEMTKSYYDRDARAAQDLAEYLHRLGESYQKLEHSVYAEHCFAEASCVLLESGIPAQHK